MLWNALSWLRDLAFSVLIAVVSIVFIYQPVKVEGTSMQPGLDDQERIFINKFTYRFGLGAIERGDTVVFRAPVDPDKSYIKRVIGLPGDRVRIEHGQVYVNGLAAGRNPTSRTTYRDYSSMEEKGGARGQVLRAGRPPQFLERQPRLGLGDARQDLRESRLRLLAAGQGRPIEVARARPRGCKYP